MDPQSPSLPEPEPPRNSSLGARLLNVFTTPSEVFEEIRACPFVAVNWVVPLLLACLVGVGAVWMTFSQEAIWRQIKEQRDQAVEKQLEKMPAEQREATRNAIERFSSRNVVLAFALGGALLSNAGWLFLVALLLWALSRLGFRGQLGYGKTLELCGLVSLIDTLGVLVKTLLILATGNLYATPSPALLLREFDPGNKLHLAMSAMNFMTLWYLAVLALGVARLNQTSALKAGLWLFIPWILFRLGLIWLQPGGG